MTFLSDQQQLVFDVLRPKPSPKPLVRIGGERDGGYLVPDDLDGISDCFSPGVSGIKFFEDELLKTYGIPSHMCDFSSDIANFKEPLTGGQTFKKLWLDVDAADNSITLADWVSELAPNTNDDLLLQMDIEGAVYRNLLTVSDDVLARFRIVVLELHRLQQCSNGDQFERELGPLLRRLDKYFICVHIHPNNCEGDFLMNGTSLNLSRVAEVTFLRRDRFVGSPEEYQPVMLPHPLDIGQNVPDRPPVFMSEGWLDSASRPVDSQLKVLDDQMRHMGERMKQLSNTLEDLQYIQNDMMTQFLRQISKRESDAVQDLAQQKYFTQSSMHSACPRLTRVERRSPFFFHTQSELRPFITVDLGDEFSLYELQIENRADGFGERAKRLQFCLHKDPAADFGSARPVWITTKFVTEPGAICTTELFGEVAA